MMDGFAITLASAGFFGLLCVASGYTIWRRWAVFDRVSSILLSPLAAITVCILVATPIYWLYRFDIVGIIATLVCTGVLSIIAIVRPSPMRHEQYLPLRAVALGRRSIQIRDIPHWVFSALYIVGLGISVFLLFAGATRDASLGPWQTVGIPFFVSYATTSFLLLTVAWLPGKGSTKLILNVIHALLTLSVLGIVFPLGFGFDPFLHRAAEHAIAINGVILPKTVYYIGQYVSVVLTSSMTSLPLYNVDVWLVPVLASLSIIPLTWLVVRSWMSKSSLLALFATLIFIVPFASMINTTPWSLAFVLFVCSFLLCLLSISKRSGYILGLAWAVAIASVFVHPLGGIPALIVTTFVSQAYFVSPFTKSKILNTLVNAILFIGGSLLAPLAFGINSFLSSQLAITALVPDHPWDFVRDIVSMMFQYASRFTVWQDLAYAPYYAWGAAVIIISLGASWYVYHRFPIYRRTLAWLWSTWGAIMINFIIIKGFIEFTSVITYERDIFSQRLYDASLIILLPIACLAVFGLLRRIFTTSKNYPAMRLIALIACAGLMTANLYVSYPKRDAYNAYHGYMVSGADIASVRWIETNAGTKQHIVLASQVLAAAAIQEYGFKQYFTQEIDGQRQDVFYYPVPTSSPLYLDYVQMLSKPSGEVIQSIKQMYGVDTVYVVVNHYEPQYEGKKNALTPLASYQQVIKQGSSEDTIFIFE